MTPEDVLEEVWLIGDGESYGEHYGRSQAIEIDGLDHVGISLLQHRDTDSDAVASRARIAACAPEALKLLLDRREFDVPDFGGGGQYEGTTCSSCDGHERDGHLPDCRWLALMKKAGLR